MKALRFHTFGGPEVLTLEEVPRPTPGPDELLVEIHAAAVNPSDAKNVLGSMPQTKPPRTPGRDFAGVVVESPKEWQGVRVFGTSGQLGFTRDGTHAEFVAVPRDAVARMPEHLSFEEAAVIGVPYVTAWEGIISRAGLKSEETILVVGGTGAVGTAATQIAKWRGARVIATTQRLSLVSDEWRKHVDTVIDLEREAIAGHEANVVLDTVGAETFPAGLHSLARGGRIVVITAATGREVKMDLFDFYRRDLSMFGVDSLKLPDSRNAEILSELAPGFQSGALKVQMPLTMRLDEARDAYEKVLKGSSQKIVLASH